MSTTVNDKMRVLRQDIRALEREVHEVSTKAKEQFLSPEVVATYNQQVKDANDLIDKKEKEIEALRNSIQLDLFKP